MMPILYTIIAVVFVIWLMKPLPPHLREDLNAEFDPSDAATVGRLIGMTGGTFIDAAVARYALERFEETHGRKATWHEVGVVAGLMQSFK